jgi:hypothetical protein
MIKPKGMTRKQKNRFKKRNRNDNLDFKISKLVKTNDWNWQDLDIEEFENEKLENNL